MERRVGALNDAKRACVPELRLNSRHDLGVTADVVREACRFGVGAGKPLVIVQTKEVDEHRAAWEGHVDGEPLPATYMETPAVRRVLQLVERARTRHDRRGLTGILERTLCGGEPGTAVRCAVEPIGAESANVLVVRGPAQQPRRYLPRQLIADRPQ